MIEISTLGSVIKETYEAEPNTNSFTDAEKEKLARLVNSTFTGTYAELTGVPSLVHSVEKAAALGVATLDATGKVPLNQLNVSGLAFKGAWNAATNTPSLVDGIGSAGDFYKVGTAGEFNFGNGSYTFSVGDWVMFAGGVWQRLGVHEAVASVNGKLGAVVLTAADVSALPSNYAPTWAQVTGKPDFPTLYKPLSYVPTYTEVTGKPDFESLYQKKQRGAIGPAIPAVLLRLNANQTIPNNTDINVIWSDAVYDQFNCWAGSNVTIPEWVKYARVSGLVQWWGNATGYRQAVFTFGGNNRAGAARSRVNAAGADRMTMPVNTGIVPVTPGEIIALRVNQSSGVGLSVEGTPTGTFSWMQVEFFE